MSSNPTYQEEIESLINSLNLPHKLVVSYALACAKSVNKKEHKPKAEALKSIELIEKWLADDKSVTSKELLDAAYDAATYAACAAAHAAYAAADAAYAASYPAAYDANPPAANAAYAASYAAAYAINLENSKIKCKELLFETIKIKYGELGLSLISTRAV